MSKPHLNLNLSFEVVLTTVANELILVEYLNDVEMEFGHSMK